MPYSTGPYALFPTLPVPPRPVLHSARAIDAPTGRYLINGTTGGFERMTSTCQRVFLLVCEGSTRSQFVTPQELEGERRRIVQSLDPLVTSAPPAIELKSVTVMPYLPGNPQRRVQFRDLTTGLDQSIQV